MYLFTVNTITSPVQCSRTVPQRQCERGDLEVAPGQVLPAALMSASNVLGLYSNNPCKAWNVITSEGQVRKRVKTLTN